MVAGLNPKKHICTTSDSPPNIGRLSEKIGVQKGRHPARVPAYFDYPKCVILLPLRE